MSNDPSARLKDLMMSRGGVIIFGPQYLESAMALVESVKGQAVFSCAKIDDVVIPDTLAISFCLVFCHSLTRCHGAGVTSAELKEWSARLLEGIVFKPAAVPGLKPEELEEPSMRFSADGKTHDVLLLVQWGPVLSKHCVDVARALERAYERIS